MVKGHLPGVVKMVSFLPLKKIFFYRSIHVHTHIYMIYIDIYMIYIHIYIYDIYIYIYIYDIYMIYIYTYIYMIYIYIYTYMIYICTIKCLLDKKISTICPTVGKERTSMEFSSHQKQNPFQPAD